MNLIDKIFEAGVVGCGGAGFPTHVKLNARPDILIINGAECEPLLRTDRYLMLHEADKLIEGIELICRERGIPNGCIALKKTYKAEIAALKEAIARSHSAVRIHEMDSFYPAGDEQVVVREVTGRIVPPAGIPLDVGAIVDNVATIIAVADAAKGIGFTEKYLTVTGMVRKPSVLKVPVGTSFKQCIEMAGGAKSEKALIVSGGPLMGKSMSWEQAMEATVTKTTSGILVLPENGDYANQKKLEVKHMLNRARAACIQCSFCTQMCPRHMLGHPLQPHRIMRKMATCTDITKMLDDKDIRQASICSECGVCEVYACPMGLNPRRINGMLKGELAKAGIRYTRDRDEYAADPNREYRKVPTHRLAVRAGVGDYYDISGHVFQESGASTVKLPLKMNIGAPAEPIISDGQHVYKGQLIAVCPNGKLGANLHASITGVAHILDQAIIITEVGTNG